jgi:hypothetical protein
VGYHSNGVRSAKENGDALWNHHPSIKFGRKYIGLRTFTASKISARDQCRSSTRRSGKIRHHIRQSARPETAFRALFNERRSTPMNTYEGL